MEMTTAEMVLSLKLATYPHGTPSERTAWDRAIAARLSALDKVATAAKEVMDAPEAYQDDVRPALHTALKEAGYGQE